MTQKEIKQFCDDMDRHLRSRRLGDAFACLRNAAKITPSWEITERIDKAEQGYGFMLRYLVDGVADPERETLYRGLMQEVALIRDLMIRNMSLPETPTLYYNTLRAIGRRRSESLTSLYDDYRKISEAMSPFNTISIGVAPSDSDKLRMEMVERDIFNRLWVTFPMNVDDALNTRDFLIDEAIQPAVRALAVSALTLGLLEFFDERKLDILLSAYETENVQISVRALIGVALVADKYKDLALSDDLQNRVESLRETSSWQADIKQVFVELIRTNDTKRIAGKLRDEILPGIKKMGENVSSKLKDLSVDDDMLSFEGNPEWKDILSDEKILGNLKALGELQQEGADVFMATFSGLKQFPFFNEASNWFLPYRADHSAVESSGFGDGSALAKLIDGAPYVCDSDKYSIMLSLAMMPDAQRNMMKTQLDSQSRELGDAMALADKSLHPVERRAEINNYILSIYRFFNLFRRKGEFYNPFARVANPVDVPLFVSDFESEEALVSLGEFYFKVGLYDYSRRIFKKLDEAGEPDATRYQKLGFCCEKLGDYEGASSYYELADLLDGKNVWNLRHLMSMLRKLSRYNDALFVAKRLETLCPDDMSVVMTLGYLYIQLGQYGEAVGCFHKVEFVDESTEKTLRPLAWALFLNRDFDESRKYYDCIIAGSPVPNDYINMGHLAWAQSHLGEAIDMYRRFAAASTFEKLGEVLYDDRKHLESVGVDVSLMPMMLDAIKYSLTNN